MSSIDGARETCAVAYDVVRCPRGSLSLALHRWVPADPVASLLYIHGLQSHAGWLDETARHLASHGIAVHVLDRRGTGQSEGDRGVADHALWIEDHVAVLAQVRAAYPALPLTLQGQSFGGTLAAAVAATTDVHDLLILAAPALNQVRRDGQPIRIVEPPSYAATPLPVPPPEGLVEVRIRDEQYTDDPRWLAFMRSDRLMLRSVSRSHERELRALAQRYMCAPRRPPIPALMVLPRRDSIISFPIAREAFEHIAPHGLIVELPTDEHYLEFSSARTVFLRLLTAAVSAPDLFRFGS